MQSIIPLDGVAIIHIGCLSFLNEPYLIYESGSTHSICCATYSIMVENTQQPCSCFIPIWGIIGNKFHFLMSTLTRLQHAICLPKKNDHHCPTVQTTMRLHLVCTYKCTNRCSCRFSTGRKLFFKFFS